MYMSGFIFFLVYEVTCNLPVKTLQNYVLNSHISQTLIIAVPA